MLKKQSIERIIYAFMSSNTYDMQFCIKMSEIQANRDNDKTTATLD